MNQPVQDSGVRCLQCHYNLTGIESARCPECGWEIEHNLIDLFNDRPWMTAQRVLLAILCGTVGSVTIFATVVSGGLPHFILGNTRAAPGVTGKLLLISSLVCAALHMVLVPLAVHSSREWPMRPNALTPILPCCAFIQIICTLLYLAFSPPPGGGGLVGYLVLFALISVIGWTLLFAYCVAYVSHREVMRGLRARSARRGADKPIGAPFIVVAAGRFGPSAVHVTWDRTPRTTNATLESAIEAAWQERSRVAMGKGQSLYNGAIGRLIASMAAGSELQLTIGPTNYRDFVGTNLFNGQLWAAFGDECFANPLGTSALVITSDGNLLMGRRSERVIYHAGWLHTFGGTLEPPDQAADMTYDVFAAVRRELREELRLRDDDIKDIVCTGLVRDGGMMQPELLFDAHVRLSRAEILARFNADTDEEHTAIESCHDLPESIVPFVQAGEPVVPVALGAIMLHGLGQWGRDWYENTSYVLFGDVPEHRTVAPTNQAQSNAS